MIRPKRHRGLRVELIHLRANIVRDQATVSAMRMKLHEINGKLDRRYARLARLVEKLMREGGDARITCPDCGVVATRCECP